uniref:Prolactin releasing hormone n=1 Tax=Sander lucioperca TaxID=283035 RepID=A0A8C9XE48_SANLU
AAMRVCAVFCAVLLLLSQALSGSHQDRSMIIRNPDIDASWYTGRGIRPVGRFGRKVARRNKALVPLLNSLGKELVLVERVRSKVVLVVQQKTQIGQIV